MPKRILLVDDEPAIVRVIESRLKANGYEVITADDGQEALNKARAEKPDLIILDVMLPKMDGFRVAQLLKLDDQYKHIPIIILTARVHEEDQKIGFATGAEAYLTKPFRSEVIVSKIEELLKESSRQ